MKNMWKPPWNCPVSLYQQEHLYAPPVSRVGQPAKYRMITNSYEYNDRCQIRFLNHPYFKKKNRELLFGQFQKNLVTNNIQPSFCNQQKSKLDPKILLSQRRNGSFDMPRHRGILRLGPLQLGHLFGSSREVL